MFQEKFLESWNGTSWTETTDLTTARYDGASWGTQTAALMVAGTVKSTGYYIDRILGWKYLDRTW